MQHAQQAEDLRSFVVERTNSIVSQFNEFPALILLKGFSELQAHAALQAQNDILQTSNPFASDGTLDFPSITSQGTIRALSAALLGASKPIVMLYEQIVPLRDALSTLFYGKVVVVDNNLFPSSSALPSAASKADLERFFLSLDGSGADSNSSIGKVYANIIPCGDSWLVSPILLDESSLDIEQIPLFEESPNSIGLQKKLPSYHTASISSSSLAEYALSFCQGAAPDTSFIFEPQNERDGALLSKLQTLENALKNVHVNFEIVSAQTEASQQTGDRLVPLLKQYWGNQARFRKLKIYDNPSSDNSMRIISQGEIAEYAVTQSETALNGSDDYHDLFITAPTGAGKSLLFQLPALYLAEKHRAITIVIEPLKALMRDQVKSLKEKGAKNVVAINSDLSYDERLASYNGIKDGSVSIVYLSPELLLSSSLDEIISGRRIGLVVIDEVHTVTSWGKDFRPDYWYLGSYLSKFRKRGNKFPIFCLTATAVYGGQDDVVMQTVRDLDLTSPRLLLGNPRRDDISFSIRRVPKSQYVGRIDEVKTGLAVGAIKRFVENNSHSIVYCPYRSHVNAVMDATTGMFPGSIKVLGFHGGMEKEYKKIVESAFKQRDCLVLVSTKAFGMGIDVDDITDVYHYAPTGNLADYVQEIGRGARKPSLRATASIDFFNSDSSYANQLYHLSRFYDWQLRDIMEKLYKVYAARPVEKRSQNLLISPNSFSYLFPDESDETDRVNRTKSALMMISKDLEERYGFPVVIVRPKPSFTKCFVCIDSAIEQQFLSKYGSYVRLLCRGSRRIERHQGQSNVHITDSGDIYELNAAQMWEDCFPTLTFADFKRRLFTGELLPFDTGGSIATRTRIQLEYKFSFDEVRAYFSAYARALGETFRELSRGDTFTGSEFKKLFEEKLGAEAPALDHPTLLLKSFVKPVDNSFYGQKYSNLKFVVRRSFGKQIGRKQETSYKLRYSDVMNLEDELVKRFSSLVPKEGTRTYSRYINLQSNGKIFETAELLEILGLASYEAHGGDEPEIFVRLNDPVKLHQLATNDRFRNRVLREMNERHHYASEVITKFFTLELDDTERWDLIEEYFLGNDARVAQVLGISSDENGDSKPKVQYRGLEKLPQGIPSTLATQGQQYEGPFFRLWKGLLNTCTSDSELRALQYLKDHMRGTSYERPWQGAELHIEDDPKPIRPMLAWPQAEVLLFDASHAEDFERAKKTNWKCYQLGGEGYEQLIEDVHVDIRE